MTLPAALRTHLAGDVDVAALAGTRITPEFSRQQVDNIQPAIFYGQIRRADEDQLTGQAFRVTVWSVTAIAELFDVAYDLGRKVETSLHVFRGTLGGVGGVPATVRILDQFSEADPERGLFSLVGEYEITEEG